MFFPWYSILSILIAAAFLAVGCYLRGHNNGYLEGKRDGFRIGEAYRYFTEDARVPRA